MNSLLPQSIWMNLGFFVLSSVGVWFTAWKLTNYLDVISDRTGLNKAFAGILFLAVATSLPEIATTATAGSSGSPQLAISNLLGGIAIQTVVLALVDWIAIRGKALTSRSPDASLIMQGVILVLIIAVAIAAFSSKEIYSFMNVGLWSVILFITYFIGLYVIYKYSGDPRWQPVEEGPDEAGKEKVQRELQKKFDKFSTSNIVLKFLFMAFGVLLFGYLLTKSAEKIVQQTGFSSGVVGSTLLAAATSLPEITTTWTAVRLGANSMAVGNILGSNSLMIALFFFADIFYRKASIITEAKQNSIFLGALGIVLTGIYIWGILERRDKTIFGMGVDSFLIILIYIGGMVLYSRM